MLDKIKLILRVDSDDLDEEVLDLIYACKLDMQSRGIVLIDEDDALIIRAVSVYCKAYFGFVGKDYERYIKSYEALRDHLAMCTEYCGVI